jgi:hypothetical protein
MCSICALIFRGEESIWCVSIHILWWRRVCVRHALYILSAHTGENEYTSFENFHVPFVLMRRRQITKGHWQSFHIWSYECRGQSEAMGFVEFDTQVQIVRVREAFGPTATRQTVSKDELTSIRTSEREGFWLSSRVDSTSVTDPWVSKSVCEWDLLEWRIPWVSKSVCEWVLPAWRTLGFPSQYASGLYPGKRITDSLSSHAEFHLKRMSSVPCANQHLPK